MKDIMKVILLALCVLLVIPKQALSLGGEVTADGEVIVGGEVTVEPDLNEIKAKFLNFFPNLQVSSVNKTPIEGMYEVVSGSQIVYFIPDRYVILGEILDVTSFKNITRERQQQLVLKKAKSAIDLSKAIKIGNGPNQVIEFIDPDCPFCRKVSAFLDKRTDVTRYVFLFPLSIHPEAESKSRYILCASNPQEAYHAVMTGKFDSTRLEISEECKKKSDPMLEASLKAGEALELNGTPFLIVNDVPIQGANIAGIERALNKDGGKK